MAQSLKDKNDIIQQNYMKYSQAIFARCFVVVQDTCLAEDCMQETFARYNKCFYTIPKEANIIAWLNVTATYVCREYLRKDKFESVGISEDLKEKLERVDDLQTQSGLVLSEDIFHKCEEDEMFYKSLTPQYQQLYDLYFRMDMKIADVAHEMGCSEGSVKMRIKRLKKMGEKYFSQKNKKF